MITAHWVADVQKAEREHAEELADGTLMERASIGLARAVAELVIGARGGLYGSRIVLLVGSGSNGGDALHAGARLAGRGASVHALCTSSSRHDGGAAALIAAGGTLAVWDATDHHHLLDAADAIVDGIVGIGASGALREPAATLVERANAADAVRIAVDLPSGIDADTGLVEGVAFDADLTVTFASAKPGLLLAPAKAHVGQLIVVDIGIGDRLGTVAARAMQGLDVALATPEPDADAHKYRRGVVGVAAGCARYPGAAVLTAGSALQGDAGMVMLLDRVDGVARSVIDAHPAVVTSATTDDPHITAWACGPGFTGSPDDAAAVAAVLRTTVPVVLDAGALSVIAQDADVRALVSDRAAPTIVTPHEGEFARLGGDLTDGRLRGAQRLAAALDAVVVLKGPGTVIAAPDGTVFIDIAGTAQLATAGSGDVLTGILGSLLAVAQARGDLRSIGDVASVAAAGCWIHGMAGRLAGVDGAPVTAASMSAQIGAAIAVAGRRADR